MKRRILAAVLILLMLVTLTACGGAKSEEAYDSIASGGGAVMEESKAEAPMAETAPMEPLGDYAADIEYENGQSQSQTQSPVSDRKFIITAWMELETTEFDAAVGGLTELVAEYEGYFENSSVANHRSGARWANYTARIPAERYEAFMNEAGTLCHETWRESNAEDITEAYYDTEGRLKTQQIKLERLQALLAQAEAMEDIITIESAISETEWQIDNLSGTLRHYDSKVNYATVSINLQEVYKFSDVETVPETFGERLSRSFNRGISNFVDAMEDLAVSFAYSWMWWLITAVVIIVVVRVVHKGVKLPKLRRRNKKMDDKQDET